MSEKKHEIPQDPGAASRWGWSGDGDPPFAFRQQRPAETGADTLLGLVGGAIAVVLVILAFFGFMIGGVLLISGFDKGKCPAGTRGAVKYSGSMARGVMCVPDPASPARARGAGSSGSYEVDRAVRDFAKRYPEIIEGMRERPKPDLETFLREYQGDRVITLDFSTLRQKAGGTGRATPGSDGGTVTSPSPANESR